MSLVGLILVLVPFNKKFGNLSLTGISFFADDGPLRDTSTQKLNASQIFLRVLDFAWGDQLSVIRISNFFKME